MKQIIPVVAACIIEPPRKGFHQTRFLLHKKTEPRNPELLGKWEFPGGMVEYGEEPEEALRREIREELNCEIILGRLICARTNIYKDGKHYLVLYYKCQHPLGVRETPNNCQWFAWTELDKIDMLPGMLDITEECILG